VAAMSCQTGASVTRVADSGRLSGTPGGGIFDVALQDGPTATRRTARPPKQQGYRQHAQRNRQRATPGRRHLPPRRADHAHEQRDHAKCPRSVLRLLINERQSNDEKARVCGPSSPSDVLLLLRSSAKITNDGSAEGWFTYRDVEDGIPFSANGPVTCLTVVEHDAWIGGIYPLVERSEARRARSLVARYG
jgi:hypothetical protein